MSSLLTMGMRTGSVTLRSKLTVCKSCWDEAKQYCNKVEKVVVLLSLLHKNLKGHDSPLYSCASLVINISVTGDEDGFVKMWDNRQGDTSVMTFKRFDEYVSSFLKIDEHHLIAASGEGTIQSFDLRREMYDGELHCMGTVRSGTKRDWTFVSLQALSAHEKSLKTAKTLHALRSFPQRKFAVKALDLFLEV